MNTMTKNANATTQETQLETAARLIRMWAEAQEVNGAYDRGKRDAWLAAANLLEHFVERAQEEGAL